jgi:hypothetical protein
LQTNQFRLRDDATSEESYFSWLALLQQPSGAKAHDDCMSFMRGLKPPPPSVFCAFVARLKSCPFKTVSQKAAYYNFLRLLAARTVLAFSIFGFETASGRKPIFRAGFSGGIASI